MKIKSLFITIFFLVGISFANAQIKGKVNKANLTQQQVEKLKAIHEKFKIRIKNVMRDKNISQEERAKKLHKIRIEEKQASKAILSPEQRARFKDLER